jgi:hypothetical protein
LAELSIFIFALWAQKKGLGKRGYGVPARNSINEKQQQSAVIA